MSVNANANATVYTSGDTPDRLWKASAREARFIVTNYTAGDDHTALKVALSLGLALEYLIMSALASLDVSLLADDRSPYSKLALARVNAGTNLDIKRLRTLTYGAALKLLRANKPLVDVETVDSVMHIRNAAAHMAMVTQKDNADALGAMLLVVANLHEYLTAFNEDEYWGHDCLPVVQNMRDEHANRLQAEFDAQILAAKERFRVLSAGIASPGQNHVYAALETRLVEESDSWDGNARVAEVKVCPACARAGRVAWTRYLLDNFEQVQTYDSAMGNDAPSVSVSVERVAVAFTCLVCGLELEKEGVVRLLGVDSSYVEDEPYILSPDEMASYYDHLDEFEPDASDFVDFEGYRRF